MEVAFYFYTIIIMLICVAAGTISLSAYFVSRKRSSLAVVSFFFFYFLDVALIFQDEYLGMNTAYQLDGFYSISQPLLKTLFAVGILESLWLITCDYLDERRPALIISPAIIFVVASFVVVTFAPEGPWKQWGFYSLRQAFLIGMLVFVFVQYRRTKSKVEHDRLHRQKKLFLVTAVLTACIIAEDCFMILIWNPVTIPGISLLPLYISERSFSENALMLFYASLALQQAAETLRLRFKEPPASSNPALQQHVDDLLPAFCSRHLLTAREQVVLALIMQGKDNQNIASELQLAVGTVKAHVHNILKKTNHTSRQDLMRDFWKE